MYDEAIVSVLRAVAFEGEEGGRVMTWILGDEIMEGATEVGVTVGILGLFF